MLNAAIVPVSAGNKVDAIYCMTMSLRCFLYATSKTNEANEVLNPSFRTAILLERDDAPDGAEEQAVTIGYLLLYMST